MQLQKLTFYNNSTVMEPEPVDVTMQRKHVMNHVAF